MILSFISLLNSWVGWASLVGFISAILMALAFHEAGHAYAAYKQGDNTAKALKRLTLKPFNHVDLAGFVCLLVLGFGWAKPVPVDPRNFKNGRKSEFFVSIAGVLVNFILGIVFSFIFVLLITVLPTGLLSSNFYFCALSQFIVYSIVINFNLCFFNLLPLFPLDGFRIIESFTGNKTRFSQVMCQYSWLILIFLILTSVLDYYIAFTSGRLTTLVIDLWSKLFGLV